MLKHSLFLSFVGLFFCMYGLSYFVVLTGLLIIYFGGMSS